MRIVDSRLATRSRTLAHSVGHARTRWTERTGLLLVLTDEEGRQGVGEATPLPGYSGESLASCRHALADIHMRLGEVDEAAPPRQEITRALTDLRADVPAAARFALETALLDLLARRRGCSLAECLGGRAPWPRLERSGLLDLLGASATERAQRLLERGLRTIKVKVGAPAADFAAELRSLETLRSALGCEVALRLDANGAWGLAEARTHLAELRPLGPEFVEEPTRGTQLLQLGPAAVPWAVDETLADCEIAERLLRAPGCAVFVIKPALIGGLVAAYDLAAAAQDVAIDIVVTHLFDGPVALAAACELALSLPRPPRACGLDLHAGLSAWPEVGLPQLCLPGSITPAGCPGLGVTAEELLA